MMLLRTLVLENSGHDTPVNGALLCGFAVPQTSSNYLAYSLDEEMEPGSSRVYIAALRKKSERYFLGSIDSKEDLQLAMHVFKQILTLAAASGIKTGNAAEAQVPYHFIDLKGSKLPPARPEDHHSLMIKKALVMKVITLGTSVTGLPAIESTELIVPSIRFSSKMVSPPKTPSRPEPVLPDSFDPVVQAPMIVTAPTLPTEAVPPTPDEPPALPAREAPPSLFEVDSTLTNLARVAQELTQQKLAVLQQEEALEQLRCQLQQEKALLEQSKQQSIELMAEKNAALQQLTQTLNAREEHLVHGAQAQQTEQRHLDELAHHLDSLAARLQTDDVATHKKAEQLATGLAHLSVLRDSLRDVFHRLDEALEPVAEADQPLDKGVQGHPEAV
ncbi:hypothetical protein FQ186_22360 [Pseudomonas sp. ANT_H14]|uniref:hypothetical protein n=1 Tax=unclassified Pseudomonas TaxID=196821 RepID=UPI0011EF18E5|nr:hypothetical protein FQ182_25960 [Pseudomonas sp. ANT_H4]KAA0949878.1 hypothetical protein FQ186_22360 [Pseudomonas sp. ANT_H14]